MRDRSRILARRCALLAYARTHDYVYAHAMARVVVIGGGLAGLVAALRLARMRHRVLVLESAARFGGQLHTVHEAGHLIELGAEGFVARSESIPKLARELGISGELRGQELTRTLGYKGGALHELAPGQAASFLGFQVAREDLGAGIRTFRKGMGQLVSALERALASDVELRPSFAAHGVERRARGYEIRGEDGVTLAAERVVIASSLRGAAEVLKPVLGDTALEFARATTSSSVTVSLAYPRAQIAHPLDATGFVVATEDQLHGARACTFTTSKFAGRGPDDEVSLRVFMRPDAREQKMLTDGEYVERAREVLACVLSLQAAPLHSWVSRWSDALPVFDPPSTQAVASLEATLRGSGIALAGSAYHGVGIDAAVRSGWSAHERF
jgi:oxygen-dependent protoporphyrinogen oxidase